MNYTTKNYVRHLTRIFNPIPVYGLAPQETSKKAVISNIKNLINNHNIKTVLVKSLLLQVSILIFLDPHNKM